jgi:hypothetical protein
VPNRLDVWDGGVEQGMAFSSCGVDSPQKTHVGGWAWGNNVLS